MTKTQIISLVVVGLLTVLSGFFIFWKSKKHTGFKCLALLLFLAMALTWIFPYGYYQGAEYYEYGMQYQGIFDIPNIMYYAISFGCDKIIFLILLGVFYAILSKCNGYKKLVHNIAKRFEGMEVVFSIFVSLFLVALTVLLNQTFMVLVFVPFLVSILLNMKFDKISTFSVTFGSILVGILGTLYGTEGLLGFGDYTGINSTDSILWRLLILVAAFVIFNFINILHIKKNLKENKKVNEEKEDPFKVENVKDGKTWPIIVVLALVFIITILGFVGWSNYFNIKCFDEFHNYLYGLTIGEEKSFFIFKELLGKVNADKALGTWTLFHGSIILAFFSIILGLCNKIKFDEFVDAADEGIKKFGKSIGLFVMVYMIFAIGYLCPFIPSILNVMFKGVSHFNPYLVSLGALISNLTYTDLGFVGYLVGSFFTGSYGTNLSVLHTIFVSTYGLLQIIGPTSAIMLVGLGYLDIDYKSWIKYIWIFAVSMLVILILVFTLMTYV